MAVIGEMHYLTIGNNTYSIPVSGGTVTNVRVQATSPVQSSSSSEQTVALDTTISLADAYGDTKNPYGTKTANYILAGPTSGSSRVPSFRQLVAADIPDLSASYLPASTSIPSKTSDLTNDSNFVSDSSYVHTDNNYTTTEKNKLNGIAAGAEVNVQSDWNVTSTSSDAFIKNKPTIPSKTSDLTNDSNFTSFSAVVSKTQPTGQTVGDLWLKVIDS